MKKFFLALIILITLKINAQDVQLLIPKLSIENSIMTLLDARAASFSSYTSGFGVDMYNVKLIYSGSHPLVVSLIPPNRFRIQCGIVGRANVDYIAGNFQINGEGDITLEGVIAASGSQGQITLYGSADAVINVNGVPGFVLNIINANQFTVQLPAFELATFVYTLPTIPLNYFTTNYPTISINNDNVILGLQTPGNFLIGDQRDQNGNRIIGSSIAHWENNTFVNYTVPAIFSTLPINTWQTFRGHQGFLLSPYQKYNNWNNLSEVENHKKFYMDGSLSRLNSNFKETYSGVKIQNNLEGTTIGGGNIYFKDPWFIDYPDPAFGNTLRNRAMTDAVFYSRPSPFFPDYNTGYNVYKYQGVFLNQGYNPVTQTWQPPYYSVKTDEVQSIDPGGTIGTRDFYFLNWSANPSGSAVFQNADALETPVVFKSENATVQANLKGHLFTNSPTATAPNNQRKIVQGSNGYWAMVYVSMNQVWLSRSTDGVNWEREINISSGDKNASNVQITKMADS
jgi:hypothetical protein